MSNARSKAVRKYLTRWAEPEAAALSRPSRRYRCALIVPARDERAEFVHGLLPALAAQPDVLLIVVVNADQSCSAAVRATNAELMGALARITAAELGGAGLLLVDRSSAGRELPAKQGVGLARKIGCDIALNLWADGNLESPWLCNSDADVTLPRDYFALTRAALPEAGALVHAFSHVAADDAEVAQATWAYEGYLRYYVLGLAWAGSPYAFHALGSCLCVHAEAYARVRGFPKREAGEDFHLLSKLAKVASVQRGQQCSLAISARRSQRVPFGTGARVRTLLSGGEPLRFDHPQVFVELRAVLAGFAAWAQQPQVGVLEQSLGAALDGRARVCLSALQGLGVQAALAHARELSSDAGSRLKHLHTWFDALATLRLLHALAAQGLPPLDWPAALAQAAFLRHTHELPRDPALALPLLRELEAKLAPLCGLPGSH